MPDDVLLRDHLERIIADQRIYFEARIAAIEKATELQAQKYEERLLKLNGEHQTLEQMATTYVRADLYRQDKEAARLAAEKLSDAASLAQREQIATAVMMQRNKVTLAITIALFVVGQAVVLAQRYLR